MMSFQPAPGLLCFALLASGAACGDDTATGGSGVGGSTWSGGNGGMPSDGGAGAGPAAGAPTGGQSVGGAPPGGAPAGGAGGEPAGGGGGNGGAPEGGAGGGGGGGAPPEPWRFTPTVDGDLADWPNDAQFVSSAATDTYIGWDDANVYIAVNHPDVATGGGQHWLLAYVGNGAVGTTSGVPHGLQEPTLPFSASFLIRWKLDNSYSSLETWNGSSWTSASPLFGSGGAVLAENGNAVELAIPLATLAVNDELDFFVTLLYEGSGFESTYAATPLGAITDGDFDPDYTEYWPFDRQSELAPSAYTPAP